MERLKLLREQKGLLQKNIAQQIGVGRTTYLKYEKGVSEPSFSVLIKLAEIFDTSTDYLLERTDVESFPPVQASPSLSATEQTLLRSFRQLNGDGQRNAMEHLNLLLDSDRYVKGTKTKTPA